MGHIANAEAEKWSEEVILILASHSRFYQYNRHLALAMKTYNVFFSVNECYDEIQQKAVKQLERNGVYAWLNHLYHTTHPNSRIKRGLIAWVIPLIFTVHIPMTLRNLLRGGSNGDESEGFTLGLSKSH